MRRLISIGLAIVALGALGFRPVTAGAACAPRLLVLSAFPGETDRLLTSASISSTVTASDRTFHLGTLAGNDVVIALTGIGLVNAEQTTTIALAQFGCFAGIVFSGVSGGKTSIGDVTVPARWTLDGSTWIPVDSAMLDTVRAVAGSVALSSDVPLGDPVCVGVDPDTVPVIHLAYSPAILIGGDGHSADPFGGRRLPCFPGGGDVFGCEPCRAQTHPVPDIPKFATDVLPFLDPNFFFGYFANPPGPINYDAEDMETAAVARVAADQGIPFIAFRALSDGLGDPLMLPGFPFQFFVYRQIAADNAARVALAFLGAWATH